MPTPLVDKLNHIIGHKGFDYTQITKEVFIGTNMCCQLGFDIELLSKNVKADISLEDLKIDAPLGVDYFLWLPTKDHKSPGIDKLTLGVMTLDFLIKRKIKVYIHCKEGPGRAPTLFAAYLIKTGMSLKESIEFIKSKRPAIHLSEDQIKSLEEFSSNQRRK